MNFKRIIHKEHLYLMEKLIDESSLTSDMNNAYRVERAYIQDVDSLPIDYFGPVTMNRAKRYFKKYPKEFGCYKFIDSSNEIIGFVFFALKNVNDALFRIRSDKIYFSEVYISSKCRGKGLFSIMLNEILLDLLNTNLVEDKSYCQLAVTLSNHNAIKAYKKNGFKIIKEVKFTRILRINFPYLTI